MRIALIYIIMMISASLLFILELVLGSVDIPFNEVLSILSGQESNESWRIIVIETRLPRALAAIVCGLSLSISGLMMQTLFRNPLAGPHILGVSAGASLGVAIVVLGIPGMAMLYQVFNDIILVLAAFIGAMAILMVLFVISLRVNDILTVLIFGILLGSISLAAVGILQYLSPESQLKAFLVWTLGSFDSVELGEAMIMLIVAIPLLFSLFFIIKPLNLLLSGEEYARSMGLDTKRNRLWIMILAGGLTAMVTAFCGPIGFIGVVVPHFSRMLLKTFDHKQLILGSFFIGINVMLFADLLAHLPGSQLILPINSITALIGIPFIFWMLIRKKMIEAV